MGLPASEGRAADRYAYLGRAGEIVGALCAGRWRGDHGAGQCGFRSGATSMDSREPGGGPRYRAEDSRLRGVEGEGPAVGAGGAGMPASPGEGATAFFGASAVFEAGGKTVEWVFARAFARWSLFRRGVSPREHCRIFILVTSIVTHGTKIHLVKVYNVSGCFWSFQFLVLSCL